MMCPKCQKERFSLCRLYDQSYSLGCEFENEENVLLHGHQREFIKQHGLDEKASLRDRFIAWLG